MNTQDQSRARPVAAQLRAAINAHGPAVGQTAAVLHAASALLDSHAALVEALERLYDNTQHIPTPATDAGLSLATAFAKARAALSLAKQV